ncbi:hypothetical protein NDU88_001220 [Pleurodeles waltl]|uniref:Uncharacterized protein n=1 Tax=Pleurodeles waltl TaxID=8319 RepID=A0AAV7MKW6_PLEWA|nr:hypothetical protein NDU88_001220 [Pleurodeles waltl]
MYSESVVWTSMAMWDAAPLCSGATATPPDGANAHKNRETAKKGGEQKKDMLSAWLTATVGGRPCDGTPNILLLVGADLHEMYRGRREVINNCAVKATSAGTCEEMVESSGVPTAGGPVDNGGKKFDYDLQV